MRARGFGPARCVSKVVGRQALPRRPWCPSQPHDSNWLGRKEISDHGRIFPSASWHVSPDAASFVCASFCCVSTSVLLCAANTGIREAARNHFPETTESS
jgi:hypothetical protein